MTRKWWIGLIVAVLTAVCAYLSGCASTGSAQWDYKFVQNTVQEVK